LCEDEWIMKNFQKKRIPALSKKLPLFILLLIIVFSFSMPGFSESAKKIKLVFRYDDYSSRSPTEIERKIFQDFSRLRFHLTVGIVPHVVSRDEWDPSFQELIPLSEDKIFLLQTFMNNGVVTPALHGYSHQTAKKNLSGVGSEFRGLSYPDQLNRIEKGKKYVEDKLGRNIDIFIPPFNIYDRNTLKVVENLGFLTFSAGLYSTSDKNSGLNILPATADLSDLRSTLEDVMRSSFSSCVVVVLFHPYDFREIDKDRGMLSYQQFQGLLEWVSGQKDVVVVLLDEIATADDFNAALFAKNRSYYRSKRLLFPAVVKHLKLINGAYLSSSTISRLQPRTWLILLACSLVFLLVGISSALVFRKYVLAGHPKMAFFVYGFSWLVLLLFGFYSFRDGALSHKGLTGLLIIIGGILGLTLQILKGKKMKLISTRITK